MIRNCLSFCFSVLVSVLCLGKLSQAYPAGNLETSEEPSPTATNTAADFTVSTSVDTDSITPLKIGDKIPDSFWDIPLKVVNHPDGTKEITLEDYKHKKLIILDFWATWCGSCVASMPKLDSLNRAFRNDIIILPVSYEGSSHVQSFWDGNINLRDLETASVVDQPEELKQLFPHKMLPHIVWLDGNGVVKGISSTEEVTAKNIENIISTGEGAIKLKEDIDTEFPLFINGVLPDSLKLQKYLIVVKGKANGLPTGAKRRVVDGKTYGQAFFNSSLRQIYSILGSQLFDEFSPKRFFFDIDSNDPFFEDNLPSEVYSVDYQSPIVDPLNIYEDILDELNKSLPYTAKIADVKTQCLVLKKSRRVPSPLRTKGGSRKKEFENGNKRLRLQNASFVLLVKWLNTHLELPIILDETGIDYKIDIDISVVDNDVQQLINLLSQQGLELVEDKRPIKRLIVTKKETD